MYVNFPGPVNCESCLTSLFQIQSDHALLRAFYILVEESYVTDGAKLVPLHVKKDPRSVFASMTAAEFDNLSTRDAQEKLRKQHIILTGVSHRPVEFDERGFSTLEKPKEALISIQGHIPLVISCSFRLIHCGLLQINQLRFLKMTTLCNRKLEHSLKYSMQVVGNMDVF
jgi:hypothetical protein